MISRSTALPAALLALSALAVGPEATAEDEILVARPSPAVMGSMPYRVTDEPGPSGQGLTPGQGVSPAKTPDEARDLGAAWLARAQGADGGWGAGAWGTAATNQASDVATTAIVVMALADAGGHEQDLREGALFIVEAIEGSDPMSPRLRTPEGTQPQYKLGQLVDTHLAALALSEVSGRFDDATDARVAHALDYVVGKVQMAQQADGSFDGQGWAPVLSSSIAAMSLYNAAEQGVKVSEDVLERAERYQTANVDVASGRADASAGAGVELYAAAGSLRNAQQAAKRGGATAPAADEVQRAMSERLDRDAEALMVGFGSIGGEEMLSYMMISDALAEQGGETWEGWSQRVGAYLMSIQNADGSWVGHHCITSPVFVTAGAVLTLSAEAAQGGAKGGGEARVRKPGASLTEVQPAG